jgi:hypothetical protein
MSHRPTSKKQGRRMRKVIERTPLPRHIDLIHYLRDRKLASTAGEARRMILDKRVVSESHPLGIARVPVAVPDPDNKGEIKVEMQDVVNSIVPADVKDTIQVLPEVPSE